MLRIRPVAGGLLAAAALAAAALPAGAAPPGHAYSRTVTLGDGDECLAVRSTPSHWTGDHNPGAANRFLAAACRGDGPRTNEVRVTLLR